jgi:hypothetical protein
MALLLCRAMDRTLAPLLGAILVALTLAGCAGDRPDALPPPPSPTVRVVDEAGAPVPYAQVSAAAGNTTLVAFNADEGGRFARASIPAAATTVSVAAPGLDAQSWSARDAVPDRVSLALAANATVSAPGLLRFRAPVDLLCTTPDQVPGRAECGQFGEPVVEVASDGTIWASAVCCIGKAPPIWISKDGGATFTQLRNPDTGLVRDAFGIEGDFAIDEAGNVYFFDISLATVWFTSYEADGTHRWTVPWAGVPLVDRPWVRAGKADQVWILYNTGTATNLYSSTDGGKTWSETPDQVFPCNLGAFGQGPRRDDLYAAASCGGAPMLWTSHDGGVTWDEGEPIPMPDVDYDKPQRGVGTFNVPVADAAGNVYVAFTHNVGEDNEQNAIFMARRGADGTWAPTVQVSQPGLNALPWGAAGREGHVGLFWYAAEGERDGQADAKWHLAAAVSVDAHAAEPHYQVTLADPRVVHEGGLGRSLGDFLQADLTPDGRLVGVYASDVDGPLVNRFVSSDGMVRFGP